MVPLDSFDFSYHFVLPFICCISNWTSFPYNLNATSSNIQQTSGKKRKKVHVALPFLSRPSLQLRRNSQMRTVWSRRSPVTPVPHWAMAQLTRRPAHWTVSVSSSMLLGRRSSRTKTTTTHVRYRISTQKHKIQKSKLWHKRCLMMVKHSCMLVQTQNKPLRLICSYVHHHLPHFSS